MRVGVLFGVFFAGAVTVSCAPVSWHESKSVVAREIVEEDPRREPARDAVDASVEVRGDVVFVRAERALACTKEVTENVTVERSWRSEPSSAFIALDSAAIMVGAPATLVGSGFLLACIGDTFRSPNGSSDACAATAPLLIGGTVLAVGGVTALLIDANKRETRVVTAKESRRWGTSTEPCERAPMPGAIVTLTPEGSGALEGTTDDAGIARFPVAHVRGPVDVEVRVNGHLVGSRRLR